MLDCYDYSSPIQERKYQQHARVYVLPQLIDNVERIQNKQELSVRDVNDRSERQFELSIYRLRDTEGVWLVPTPVPNPSSYVGGLSSYSSGVGNLPAGGLSKPVYTLPVLGVPGYGR